MACIERAIKSVLSQSVSPEEIIVIDDGSTDGGGDVVRALNNSRIKLIRQENQGVSAARNGGISEAEGDLIAFLDADDAWEPRFLEVILGLREKYPEAGAYATAYRIIRPDGTEKQLQFKFRLTNQGEGLIENYFRAALFFPVWTSAVATPKKVLEEIGGFHHCEIQEEDVDAWLRIALRYSIAWSSEQLAIYYQNAENRSLGFKRWSAEPRISLTAREAVLAGMVPFDKIKDLQEYAAHFQVSAARDCLLLSKKATALQLLEYCRGTQRFSRKWWKWRLLAATPGNLGPWLWRVKQRLKRWLK
jgi:glycosyltransferase involved in cell wall biosynthesis